ncbi:hypothetical protein PWT90_00822 [Aphanocladium album]|nr:hypothetical protein PWT90_00822 [Aphanocladium album]
MEQELPPPYAAQPVDDVQSDPIVEPTIYVLAGQSVYTETLNSPAAYELSRNVATLTKATEKVEFERCDQTIGATSDESGTAIPTVKLRRRHLYDLRRTAKQPRIGLSRSRYSFDAPEYYIHSLSRRTLGHLGLSKCSSGGFAAGFSAVPVYLTESQQVRFSRYRKRLFTLRREGDRSHWLLADGDETVVAIEDAADNQHRLIFIKAITRREVDALVALWCCRIWQAAAVKAEVARAEVEGTVPPSIPYKYHHKAHLAFFFFFLSLSQILLNILFIKRELFFLFLQTKPTKTRMCERIPNNVEYQCRHRGTPTTIIRRCRNAQARSNWDACKDPWDRTATLGAVTKIEIPCQACKLDGSWVEYHDQLGRVKWKKAVGAINPPNKVMCNAAKIYFNYTKCGHCPEAPVHAVGPPCRAANYFKPGRYYCSTETLTWKTTMEAMDEPCPACKEKSDFPELVAHEISTRVKAQPSCEAEAVLRSIKNDFHSIASRENVEALCVGLDPARITTENALLLSPSVADALRSGNIRIKPFSRESPPSRYIELGLGPTTKLSVDSQEEDVGTVASRRSLKASESAGLRLLEEKAPDVPVPLVFDIFTGHDGRIYVVLTRMPGVDAWGVFYRISYAVRKQLADDLTAALAKVRATPNRSGRMFCGPDGGKLYDPQVVFEPCGPFDTEDELHNSMTGGRLKGIKKERPGAFARSHPPVFSHGNLYLGNVMVDAGKLTDFIDWEKSGFYPGYGENRQALRGAFDHPDAVPMWHRVWGNRFKDQVGMAMW